MFSMKCLAQKILILHLEHILAKMVFYEVNFGQKIFCISFWGKIWPKNLLHLIFGKNFGQKKCERYFLVKIWAKKKFVSVFWLNFGQKKFCVCVLAKFWVKQKFSGKILGKSIFFGLVFGQKQNFH